MRVTVTYKISTNKRIRVYTIREYWNGHLAFKYRSYPLSKDEFIDKKNWTQENIANFIRKSRSKYRIVTESLLQDN
jgi:hypothetical protein